MAKPKALERLRGARSVEWFSEIGQAKWRKTACPRNRGHAVFVQPSRSSCIRSQRTATRLWPPTVQVKSVRSQSPVVISSIA